MLRAPFEGVTSRAALVAKLTGRSEAEVDRAERHAEAGAALIGALADNAAWLRSPARWHELAVRLAPFGAQAKEWLATRPPTAKRAIKTFHPLCFDAKRSLVPCVVTKP